MRTEGKNKPVMQIAYKRRSRPSSRPTSARWRINPYIVSPVIVYVAFAFVLVAPLLSIYLEKGREDRNRNIQNGR